MKISVIGKKYKDIIVELDQFNSNETNKINPPKEKLGGVFNVLNLDLHKSNIIEPILEGLKQAIIINERSKSIRSSLTWDIESYSYDLPTKTDWIHVMYIDDISDPFKLLYSDIPISLDFCTDTPREKYNSIINCSEFVLDSRERKNLYSEIKSETPIILHDRHGCEINIQNEVVFSLKINPIEGISVNGAGDIFSVFFIEEYKLNNLHDCCKIATSKTVKELIRRNNEKV